MICSENQWTGQKRTKTKINEVKEINIKNLTRYYFDDISNIDGLDLHNILLDEKSNENILTFDFAHKIPYGAKAVHIIFDKVDGCIRKYDRTKYLVLDELDILLC